VEVAGCVTHLLIFQIGLKLNRVKEKGRGLVFRSWCETQNGLL
jgi:hypothetical protein